MSEIHDEPGHGNSIAAWTAVIVAIIGVALATLGVLLSISIATTAGSIITVLSLAIGPILAKAGFGVAGKKTK